LSYDSPKAANFIAMMDGVPLKWNVETGLNARWEASRFIEKHIPDMMRASEEKIEKLLAEWNSGRMIQVVLAKGAV
jgi:hypothetical protein